MADQIHSTGRGGAGNIGEDTGVYSDGGIVREGVVGESDKPEFSTGRGGAGNVIESPRMRPSDAPPSEDVVPEPATRAGDYDNFHTGRGGQGNVHKEKYGGHSSPDRGKEGLGDKVKHLFGKDKHKEESPLKQGENAE